jgi:hypothetical protein
MARNIRLVPYDEQIEPFDEAANNPECMIYGSPAPSTATESYFPPEDSMPLFLSDDAEEFRATESYFPPEDSMPLFLAEDAEEARQRGFGTGGERSWNRVPVWPRILKAGILAASAAAIAFAIVSVENPLALFADAKASLVGTSPPGQAGVAVKSASQPPAPLRLASAGPPGQAIQMTVGARTSLPAVAGGPTRDEIAAALRSAHQSQPEIHQPPAVAVAPVAAARPAAASPPTPVVEDIIPRGVIYRPDPGEIAASLTRANALIASGDLAAARLVLQRAADSGDARSAMTLAETYDPEILAKLAVHGVVPDLALARDWYEKAKRFGAAEAAQRLELLASKEH